MKKISLLISILIITAGFGFGQVKKSTINGELQNVKEGQSKIFLFLLGDKAVKLDSTVIKGGKFTFTVPHSTTEFYKVMITKDNFITLAIQPGQKVFFKAEASSMQTTSIFSGSPESALISDIVKMSLKYDTKLDSLEDIYDKASEEDKESLSSKLIAEYETINKEKHMEILNTLQKNKDNIGVLPFLDNAIMDENLSLCSEIDSLLVKKYKDNVMLKTFSRKVATAKNLAIGAVAPEINLPDPNGTLKALSSLRGKYVMIDFWASWCSPCRKENPNVVRLYEKYKDKGFDVFSVSLDREKAAWLKAIEMDKLTWNHVSDLKFWQSQAAKDYNVESIPFTVLLDKEGKIIAKGLRGEQLEEKLKELMGE